MHYSQPSALEHSTLPLSVEESAGGIVVTGLAEAVADNGDVDLSAIYVALIGRMNRRNRLLWSMPKGHVEEGEKPEYTAEREIWEETGVRSRVLAPLGTVDYWFVMDGVRTHKTVQHFVLEYVDGVFNDDDPEVHEVRWFPAHAFIQRMAYIDERRLGRIAKELIPQLARAAYEEKRALRR